MRTSQTLVLPVLLLVALSSNVYAAPATVTTESALTPDGCIRIKIKVDPGADLIKDVHLRVARTKQSATKVDSVSGDPKDRNYRDPTTLPGGTKAGAPTPALPAGWTYSGPTEAPDPAKAGESDWNISWLNPGAALGGPFDFSVDYCGDKKVEAAKKENVFLTKNGLPNWARGDLVKEAKGQGPVIAVALPEPSTQERQPAQSDGEQVIKK